MSGVVSEDRGGVVLSIEGWMGGTHPAMDRHS